MNWDEENSKEPITTLDTANKTRINSNEGELSDNDKTSVVGGRTKWERLSTLNTGAADSFGRRNSDVARKQERAAAFDVISDQLHLPDYLHREGRNLMMEEVDVSGTNQNTSLHLIAFCLSAALVNELHDSRSYHPNRSKNNNDELFVETLKEFNFSVRSVSRNLDRIIRRTIGVNHDG